MAISYKTLLGKIDYKDTPKSLICEINTSLICKNSYLCRKIDNRMKVTIEVNGLRLYARHGVAPQERLVGNVFDLDIHLVVEVGDSVVVDDLVEGTVSYADVVEVARREMDIPSRLLEHVVARLQRALTARFPSVEHGQIRLAKLTPPMGVEVASAAVGLEW
jgi:dihydroneopterin aldolase